MPRSLLIPALIAVTSTSAFAAPPAWWASRGATNSNPAADSSPVNQGQLKHFTSKAVDELNAALHGGAGYELTKLVKDWEDGHPDPDDTATMSVGQLKWIAYRIHGRLMYLRWEENTPEWLWPALDDNTLANLGQLKSVFNFDLSAPAGQIPNWWKLYYFGNSPFSPTGDDDGDGLNNLGEYLAKSDPINDTDNDGLADWWELAFFNDLSQTNDGDPDGDGIINVLEMELNEDPTFKDSDRDGLQDDWEMHYFGSLLQTAYDDPDNDTWVNYDEFIKGTDPTFQDEDEDLWLDSDEITHFGNLDEPGNGDFDSDGLSNADETMIHGSDPTVADSNSDGVLDGVAFLLGISIVGSDSDGDGLSNSAEVAMGTNPAVADTDGDGVNDSLDPLPLDPWTSTVPSGGGIPGAPVVTVFSPPDAVIAP